MSAIALYSFVDTGRQRAAGGISMEFYLSRYENQELLFYCPVMSSTNKESNLTSKSSCDIANNKTNTRDISLEQKCDWPAMSSRTFENILEITY